MDSSRADIKRSIRVGLVNTAPRDRPGSMQAYAETLVHALQQHGRDVCVEVHDLVVDSGGSPLRQRFQTLSLPLRAVRTRRPPPDLWHVLDGSRAYLAPFLTGAPVVVTVHDIIPWLQNAGRFAGVAPLGIAARTLWKANGLAYRRSAALVCDSQSTRVDVQTCFRADDRRCSVVPLPIRVGLDGSGSSRADSRDFCGGAREPVVLHVGNNAFYKNRAGVLRIFAAMASSATHRLVMLGPPPLVELRALACSLGIDQKVEWVGDCSDEMLIDWYRRARLLLFPSNYEGFGWPVLEAMAHGTPVVASSRGSLPEVVGSAGACIDPDDVPATAAAADRLLSDGVAWTDASVRGAQQAAGFSLPQFADRMLDVYVRSLSTEPLP